MSVPEIQTAIQQLSASELSELAEWFERYHGEIWDQQIERDQASGRLDDLVREAHQDFDAGRYSELRP